MSAIAPAGKRVRVEEPEEKEEPTNSGELNGKTVALIKSYQPHLNYHAILAQVETFSKDPLRKLARNITNEIHPLYSVIDSTLANKVNHIFEHTLIAKDVKATNQLFSGRCWMFAGLNTLRHDVIKRFNLSNFEFSQTYLFFFDKLERIDFCLIELWRLRDQSLETFLVRKAEDEEDLPDHYLQEILEKPIEDGGWWNYFANLVNKYGLIPSKAMQETRLSSDSDDLNYQLKNVVRDAAFLIRKATKRKHFQEIRVEVLKRVTNYLIITLGEPPKTFDWAYQVSGEREGKVEKDLTPMSFKDNLFPYYDLNEKVIVVAHYPRKGWAMNTLYESPLDINIIGGSPRRFINCEIENLIEFVKDSIDGGIPVWFGGDIHRGYSPLHAALDEKLFDDTPFVGKPLAKLNKGERLELQMTIPAHAMVIVGYNTDANGKITHFQVENSWGYEEYQEPGLDGFLSMSIDWFIENVFEIAVPSKMVKKKFKEVLKKEPVLLKKDNTAATHNCSSHRHVVGFSRAAAPAGRR